MNSFHHEIIHEFWMDGCVDYIYSSGGEGPRTDFDSGPIGSTGMSTDVLLSKLQQRCDKWTHTALSYLLEQGLLEGFYKQIDSHWHFCYNNMIKAKRNNALYSDLNPMMCCPCYLHQYCLVHS